MSMTTRWAGKESTEAIADVRMRCYGTALSQRNDFIGRTQRDRFGDGDVVIAEQDGRAIGTATHVPLAMWVRGTKIPCQGVAWVGTIKSHRRRRLSGRGVASAIMQQILARGRERGDVVSALMPFRASFYEHFGYGVVEQQNVWTVPLAILPTAESDGFVEATKDDIEAMAACRSRQAQRGQCDVDGGAEGIKFWMKEFEASALWFADRPDPSGPVRGFLSLTEVIHGGQATAVVDEPAYDSPESLLRLLGFLGSLKDQYSAARIHLPVDLPLNWLLKERQVPHRRVDHPTAMVSSLTRMQVRILDHVKLLSSLHLPTTIRGRAVVAIRESEGTETRLALDIADGRVTAKPTTMEPALTLPDQLWASLVTGAIKPRTARELGLLVADDATLSLLDAFGVGPAPFSWEYF